MVGVKKKKSVFDDTDILISQAIGECNTTADHAEVWKCLPSAIAMTFFTNAWRDTNWKFDLLQNSHLNSANLIIRSLNCLLATFRPQPKSIVPANPSGVADEDGFALLEVVRISAYVVLRMREKIDIERVYHTKDMVILIDKVNNLNLPLLPFLSLSKNKKQKINFIHSSLSFAIIIDCH